MNYVADILPQRPTYLEFCSILRRQNEGDSLINNSLLDLLKI